MYWGKCPAQGEADSCLWRCLDWHVPRSCLPCWYQLFNLCVIGRRVSRATGVPPSYSILKYKCYTFVKGVTSPLYLYLILNHCEVKLHDEKEEIVKIVKWDGIGVSSVHFFYSSSLTYDLYGGNLRSFNLFGLHHFLKFQTIASLFPVGSKLSLGDTTALSMDLLWLISFINGSALGVNSVSLPWNCVVRTGWRSDDQVLGTT